MNDEQFQAWLDQHGGEVGRKDEEKDVDGPKDPETGLPSKVRAVDSTTITAKDGATITLRRNPGPYVGNTPVYSVVGHTPAKPATGTPRTPEQTATDAANAQIAQGNAAEATRIRNESQWNADPANRANGGSGRYEDHATRDARLAKEKKDADTAAQTAATAAAASRRADSAEARAVAEANRVGSKVESLTIGGKQYTRITKTSPDGKTTTIENYGPDGARIASLPSEGAATAGGPKMPQIIAGQSEQALIAYHTALANDPSLTPAQRNERFGQAVQIANIATQEAATAQRDRESQRNAEYNTASTKLNYLQSGMGQALDYVTKLNGTLDPGSDLGGKAFAAILGLQLIQMGQSGINTLPSTAKPATPTLTPRDLNDPQRLAAKSAEIYAHPVFRPQAPVNVQPVAAASAAPAAPVPARTTATAAPAPLPANRPDQTQAAAQIENAINPPAAQPAPVNPAPVGQEQPNVAAPSTPPNDGRVLPDPNAPVNQMPVDVPYPTNDAAVSQAAPPAWQQYSALADYQRAAPMPAAPQPAVPAEIPFAALHEQAASKPVWQMTEEEYRRYKAAGIPDDVIFKVPGVAA